MQDKNKESITMDQTKKFGLRAKKSGKVVGYTTLQRYGGYSCEPEYILDANISETIWLVNDAKVAEYVRLNQTEWYNAEYETPSHNFSPEEFGVVEIEIVVKATPVGIF